MSLTLLQKVVAQQDFTMSRAKGMKLIEYQPSRKKEKNGKNGEKKSMSNKLESEERKMKKMRKKEERN